MDSLTHAASGALVGAAVSQVLLPEAWEAAVLIGAVAGSIVDIDFLAELHSKKAAWKYHRVATHNLPIALILSIIIGLIGSYWLPLTISLLICIVATILHLCLDVLTSFGTCLWFPFNRKRYSTRSHFIFDPWVLGLSVYGVVSNQAILFLCLLALYLLITCSLKPIIQKILQKTLPEEFLQHSLHIEPTFLAPLRWLLIVRTEKGYVYSYQTLFWRSRWLQQNYGDVEFDEICQQHELMKHVLNTFDMPVYKFVETNNEPMLIVEDIKWRLEQGLRPLAFTLTIEKQDAQWKIVDVKQGSFFQTIDNHHFVLTPY